MATIQKSQNAPQGQASKDVMFLPEAQQKKWLEQRGYIPSIRDNIVMWRHPETGIRYIFTQALKMALQDCRLPADYQLTVELPSRKTDETATDGALPGTIPGAPAAKA